MSALDLRGALRNHRARPTEPAFPPRLLGTGNRRDHILTRRQGDRATLPARAHTEVGTPAATAHRSGVMSGTLAQPSTARLGYWRAKGSFDGERGRALRCLAADIAGASWMSSVVVERLDHEEREVDPAGAVACEDRVADVLAPDGQALTFAFLEVATTNDRPSLSLAYISRHASSWSSRLTTLASRANVRAESSA